MPLAIFLLAFFFIPVSQLDGFAMMPGDIGDARLNNYFLENVYQFFAGNAVSLWHLSFFFPFPYVLGFSDNLFGSAPVYALARLITGKAGHCLSSLVSCWLCGKFWCRVLRATAIERECSRLINRRGDFRLCLAHHGARRPRTIALPVWASPGHCFLRGIPQCEEVALAAYRRCMAGMAVLRRCLYGLFCIVADGDHEHGLCWFCLD